MVCISILPLLTIKILTHTQDMKYPEAVQHYSEALRRGPPSVNTEAYKLYSNLAACYTKLGAYPDGAVVNVYVWNPGGPTLEIKRMSNGQKKDTEPPNS